MMMLPSLPLKTVILHSLLTDLVRKAPRAVFSALDKLFLASCDLPVLHVVLTPLQPTHT